ncbi:glutamate receptor ionotropic, kainate 2-like [Mycetomoellerius zeteki]|uniref:glutamate receptor ionotropic, kainate 2-like n=1 Tax=Mycetomoellerius zeteki TaxID=64791 RepID=UPI00084E7028|nr:PREDICTED: glutamate receptor ionotropic, kainate 2-like [Trachymyrmex zeteki]XP_018315809.1 PREDICTED: glutamate receptor ionotropic, kainate 2-like [Trachymyrmex zeteki]
MDSRQYLFSTILILLVLATRIHGLTRPIKIGAIFHKGDEHLNSAFLKAISDTKYENLAPAFELTPVIKYIDANTDSFKTALAACDLLEEGVAAIFGPASRHTRGIVASIAALYDIPHIEYVWRENEGSIEKNEKKKILSSMTINVFPASEQVSQAIADVIASMKWRNFAAIYETDEGLSRLQKTLTLKGDKDNPIVHTVRQLNEESDYRAMLKEIRSLSVCNIIIDVKPEHIMEVLQKAKEVRLLADYCDFVLTYMDSSKLPILEMRNGTVNITGLSIRENDIEGIDWLDSAVLYDAVFLLQKALETLNARNIDNEEYMSIDPIPLSCTNNTIKYQVGPNITSVMRELSQVGKITGFMNIDEYGRRQDFNVKIFNFRPSGMVQTGFWERLSGVNILRTQKEQDSYLYKSMEEKTFTISVKESAPYIMEVKDGSMRGELIDQKRYEGYCIDLINYIAKFLHFKGVVFEMVPDQKHGKYDPVTKTWDGLIRRILDREADLAICDLTITYERKSAVDFSLPFMNLGISIVFNKPEEKVPDFFSFLLPLSTEVWFYMATAFLGVSIMLFLQARMAPGEWDNPHPCNADPEELENNFNFKNSFWLNIGSLMQQGSDILPKAPSLRMLASMWWFFTLIMISSYTANLAAFLTVDKMDAPIKGVEDLAKQTKIKYGALEGGSTSTFFKDSNYSTYKRMWATMLDSRPSVFTSNNDEGVDRVIKGKRQYAFLMESTTIEYKMERNCDIIKIGGLIDNKGYGIAMPRNSPYRTPINRAILTLGEKGVLLALKKKWWQDIGGGLCIEDEAEKSASTSELGLASVGGVFFVLMCGLCGSFFIAICEFLWNIRKVAVTEKVTPWEALIAELKFAVNIFEVTKPVKISKSSNSSASSMGGFGRAASTARSIVGSFLRLDMVDKFDKDLNMSNRTNDRKIN